MSRVASALPRSLVLLRGSRVQTRAEVEAWLVDAPRHEVLDISAAEPGAAAPAQARRRLGRGFLAVVLDLHDTLDVDLIALAAGFVWGGGALVLRLNAALAPDPRLVVAPWTSAEVGTRLAERLCRVLVGARATRVLPPLPRQPPPVGPTPAQDAVVARLAEALGGGAAAVLTAPRGRGKSVAIGRALAACGLEEVRLLAPSDDAVAELRRFAGAVRWLDASEGGPTTPLVIDEAAQLPLAQLRAALQARPEAPVLLASTTEGYEGTGQGLRTKLLPWLRTQRAVEELTLDAPLRFPADDLVEAAVSAALCLGPPRSPPSQLRSRSRRVIEIAQDQLAADEGLLTELVQLLAEAHYRTTPSDLHRWLDAPNLRIFGLVVGGDLVGVNVLALEGRLTAERCARAIRGDRLRGQALADTLMCHSGWVEAGQLALVRSLRLAIRADQRGRGLGGELATAAMAATPADLWGTVFAAAPEVLAFRRSLGFRLVRMGSGPGVRSGLPSVVMLRPTASTEAPVHRLTEALARELPLQLDLAVADAPFLDRHALATSVRPGLPDASPWPPSLRDARIAAYAAGRLHLEGAAGALVDALDGRWHELEGPGSEVLVARLVARKGWRPIGAVQGGVRAAQRAARAAVRVWWGAASC